MDAEHGPRTSVFLSHKVAEHAAAARAIKAILKDRCPRIDVHMCEEIRAGDRWRDWISKNLREANELLVLWPSTGTELDSRLHAAWIYEEISQFEETSKENNRESRRLTIIKEPAAKLPYHLEGYESVDATTADLEERFLKPLYQAEGLVPPEQAPNGHGVTPAEISRDARMIFKKFASHAAIVSEQLESVTVLAHMRQGMRPADMEHAETYLTAPFGLARTFNFTERDFHWNELKARAEEERGKGTFWIDEMARVLIDVFERRVPEPMSSTFRARGPEVAGRIFRVDCPRWALFSGNWVRCDFVFRESLVPELVRGPHRIGAVFGLLHVATRARWEVFHPFLAKKAAAKGTTLSGLIEHTDADEQRDMITRVVNSLELIDEEAERHNLLDQAKEAFDDKERGSIERLLERRKKIRAELRDAARQGNFKKFVGRLREGLDVVSQATEIMTCKLHALAEEDRRHVDEMLRSNRAWDPTWE